MSLLRIEALRTVFATRGGEVQAVDGVDLALDAGRTLGIVGESGCGKSVLSLSVMGLVPRPGRIAAGRILLNGRDLTTLPPRELRAIRGREVAMIFQEPMTSLNPVHSIGRQIEEAMRAHEPRARDLRARAVQALTRVRIPAPAATAEKFPHQLSGGMRQRVMIAMALACRPQLLIADEPTTALDVTVQAQILDLLRELQAETGMAIVLITHDLGVVAEMADEVAVMYAGRVVERAPAAAIFDDPQHPYTLGLLGSIPRLDAQRARLPAIEGMVPPAFALPSGCAFHPRCPFAAEPCRAAPPPLRPLRPAHLAACLRAPVETLTPCPPAPPSSPSHPGPSSSPSHPAPPSSQSHPAPPSSSCPDSIRASRATAADRPPPASAVPRPPAAAPTPLLAANDLQKTFPGRRGAVQAVAGVSLTLDRGETLALVGESGCGKSTTARLVLRLLDPNAGRLRLDDDDVTTLAGAALRKFRRRVQIVFQDPYASLDPRMTVGEAIAEPLLVHGIGDTASRRARVAELLGLVGLAPFHAARFPHEFSGGQRQRIGIARALAIQPELVVCDEPVSALDVSIQAQVVNLLKDLQARFGLAYLFIAHDLAVVRHMADRVAVMYLGRIVEQAPTATLFADPRHPYTRALLAAIPRPDPARRHRAPAPIAAEPPNPAAPPPGCHFHPRCPQAQPVCREQAPPLRQLAPGHASACHFAEALPPYAQGAAAALSAVAAERLALYAAASERRPR